MPVNRLSVLSQFQGVLVGAAIAPQVTSLSSNRLGIQPRVASESKGSHSESSGVELGTLNSPAEAVSVADAPTDRSVQILLKSLLTLIPPEDWARIVLPNSLERVNTQTVQFGSLPLEGAIALIPLILYTHYDASDASALSAFLQSFSNTSRLPMTVPLTPTGHIVRHTLSTLLNQEYLAPTYLSDLICYLEDENLKDENLVVSPTLINILRAVHEAVGDRRGTAWLLESLTSIASDDPGLQGSKDVPSVPIRSSTEEDHVSMDLFEMGSSLKEAIAIGCILYCFCSTPMHYVMATARLKHLIQKSMLEDTFIAPASSLLGSFLGGHIGLQEFQSSTLVNPSSPTDRAYRQTSPQSDFTIASLSLLGTYLWARWSGIDPSRLSQYLDREVEPLLVTTAVPGVIRRFGN